MYGAGDAMVVALDEVTVGFETERFTAINGPSGSGKPTLLVGTQAALDAGCDEVVWVDAIERRWLEEAGTMNLVLVARDRRGARIITPPAGETVLAGITRNSLLSLAASLGIHVEERRIALDEWRPARTAARSPNRSVAVPLP